MQQHDRVVAQYRRVAKDELERCRDAAANFGLGLAAPQMVDALERVQDMARMLRHRRTDGLLTSAIAALRHGSFPDNDVHRVLDAVERSVNGGRPDPRVLRSLGGWAAEPHPVMS